MVGSLQVTAAPSLMDHMVCNFKIIFLVNTPLSLATPQKFLAHNSCMNQNLDGDKKHDSRHEKTTFLAIQSKLFA